MKKLHKTQLEVQKQTDEKNRCDSGGQTDRQIYKFTYVAHQ